MRKPLTLLLALAAMLPALAQDAPKLHTPAEILQILTDSKVQYEIGILAQPLRPTDQTQNLNYNNVYRRRTASGFSTVRYSQSDALENVMTKAENAFAGKQYDSARAYYLQALETDTSYYTVLTYIGQTYGIQKNWDKAIEWYQKAIRSNYIDYMAHWFLADAYIEVKEPEEAKKEILIAHILNRNNPRIRLSLNYVLKNNGLSMNTWIFNPQYTVTKDADNKVKVQYGDGWLSYALTKAVWAHEPGYSESMGYKNDSFFRELEEKEALIGMLISEDPKTQALPETLALQKATADGKENRLQEFVFYEILLPKHPAVALQLPDQLIEDIMAYILEVRCEKI
ncbi:MAG: tetratricopeptide repeat protein [Chitinophagaceae bacterium]